MTDNEIIKALECCLKGCNAEGCEDCPLYEKVEDCEIEIPIIALDLINRQKVEIERLQSMNQAKLDMIHDIRTELKTAKSEAIKKFANRLKCGVSITSGIITCVDIDNLVKEMTEDPNDQQKT